MSKSATETHRNFGITPTDMCQMITTVKNDYIILSDSEIYCNSWESKKDEAGAFSKPQHPFPDLFRPIFIPLYISIFSHLDPNFR